MSGRRTTALVLAVGLVLTAGCKKEVEKDCQPVGSGLLWQLQRASSTHFDTAYAVPSRTVDGIWLIGASTTHGVAVWTSSVPPDGSGVSFVLNANQAAVDDSVVGVDVPEGTGAPAADALKDTAGIAAAAACAANGGVAPAPAP